MKSYAEFIREKYPPLKSTKEAVRTAMELFHQLDLERFTKYIQDEQDLLKQDVIGQNWSGLESLTHKIFHAISNNKPQKVFSHKVEQEVKMLVAVIELNGGKIYLVWPWNADKDMLHILKTRGVPDNAPELEKIGAFLLAREMER